jgi:hypothetical protein
MKSVSFWSQETSSSYYRERVDPTYFPNYIFRLVKPNLDVEFTVEEFMTEFNRLPNHYRETKCYGFNRVETLSPNYHYHYKIVSQCLHHMVSKGLLKVRYESLGSRTVSIFEK